MLVSYDSLFIGGEWVRPSSPARIEVTSASTEENIGSVPEAAEADVDAAVASARRAFEDPDGWSHWEPSARAAAMERLAVELEARASEMAQRVSAQNGMPISIATMLEGGFPVIVRLVARQGPRARRGWPSDPAGSMSQRAGYGRLDVPSCRRAGRFRGRMVIPDGLVRNQRRVADAALAGPGPRLDESLDAVQDAVQAEDELVASSAFVPVRTMPWWLRGFARHQPATPVTETIRGLLLRPPGGVPLGTALAWCGGIMAVSVALSVWLFRRRTA